jgi:hypothetical protein
MAGPWEKYQQTGRAQAQKPAAAPAPVQNPQDRIQAIAKQRAARDALLNPSGFTSAAPSGLMSWLPFEAGTRLAAGLDYLTGGQGKSYQDQLAIERATEALERQRSGTGNFIGSLVGALGGGAGLSKGVEAGATALSKAPGIAGKVGQLAQRATTLQRGQKAANAAKLALGGGTYAGTEAALDQKSPTDIARSAAVGAAAAPLAVGGLKTLGWLGRTAGDVLHLKSAGSILRSVTDATQEEIQKAADAFRKATGAEPTLYELLPKADRERVASTILGASGNVQDTAAQAVRNRVANIRPEMQQTVQNTVAPARARVLTQMRQDLANSRNVAPADLTPEENALTQRATEAPIALENLRNTKNQNIMQPVKDQVVVPDVESLYPTSPQRTSQGDIVETHHDPEANAAIRNAAGSLKLRRSPDEDAVQGLSTPISDTGVPGGLTGDDVASIVRRLTVAANKEGPDRGAAQRALAHVTGVISDNNPAVAQAIETMRGSHASTSRMMEGLAEGGRGRLQENIPVSSRSQAQEVQNAYESPEGTAGRTLGQANLTERSFAGTPEEGVRAVQDLAGSSATREPIVRNIGAPEAEAITNAAQAQAQSVRNLASSSSNLSKQAETAPSVGDIGAALLALSPGSMVHTRLFALTRLKQLTNVSDKKANYLIDRILSQDPAKTQQGLNMLDNMSAQGKRFLGELTAGINAANLGNVATNPQQPGYSTDENGRMIVDVPGPETEQQAAPPTDAGPWQQYQQPQDQQAPPSDLYSRVLNNESGSPEGQQFNTDGSIKVSPAGAVGAAQIMPATAPEAAQAAGLPYDEHALYTNADYNKALGAAHLQKLLTKFNGNQALALAAYNAGEGAVRKAVAKGQDNWLALLPKETQDYVTKALPGS